MMAGREAPLPGRSGVRAAARRRRAPGPPALRPSHARPARRRALARLRPLAHHGAAHPDVRSARRGLIFTGALDRHPRLDLLLAHGGGVLPFVAGRLDATWAAYRPERWHGPDILTLEPSTYLRRFHVDTNTWSRAGAAAPAGGNGAGAHGRRQRSAAGLGELDDSLALLAGLDLTDARARAVLWRNAARLFRLREVAGRVTGETEVLIVGGGIAGASAAYHLAAHGRRVALLERGEIASGASGVNGGLIDCVGWGDQPDLQAHLTAGSVELFEQAQLDLGEDLEFRRSGSLQAIHTPEQYEFTRARVAEMRGRGQRVELISDPRGARARARASPADLLGAMYSPLRAQADPVKATRAFATLAGRRGARILTGHDGHRAGAAAGGRLDGARAGRRGDRRGGPRPRRRRLVRRPRRAARPRHPHRARARPDVGGRGAGAARFSRPSRPRSRRMAWHRDPGAGPAEPDHSRRPARDPAPLRAPAPQRARSSSAAIASWSARTRRPIRCGIRPTASMRRPCCPSSAICRRRAPGRGSCRSRWTARPSSAASPAREHLWIVSGLASSGFGRGPMAGKLLADSVHGGQPLPILAEADPAGRVRELSSR